MLIRAKWTALLVGSFISASAFAGSFTIEETDEATGIALGLFKAGHADHIEHFAGFKSWKSGDDAKVKVYVDHDGMAMEYLYLCHKHDNAIECHAQ